MIHPPHDDRGDADEVAEHRMPNWVRWFVAVGILVVVLLLVAFLSGGDHGPARHAAGAVDALRGQPDGWTTVTRP